MNNAITIEVQQLRAALDLVLSRLERRCGPAVELTADYYWEMSPEAMYDPLVDPAVDTLGALSEDVQEIQDLLTRGDEVIVWHDLQHLVGVLQRIAAQDLETQTGSDPKSTPPKSE